MLQSNLAPMPAPKPWALMPTDPPDDMTQTDDGTKTAGLIVEGADEPTDGETTTDD